MTVLLLALGAWLLSYAGFYLVLRRLYAMRREILTRIAKGDSFVDGIAKFDSPKRWLRFTFLLNFILLASFLGVLAYKFESNFSGKTSHYSTTTLYETRSILGYGEAVAIGSVAVFLPLLVFLWNSSQESVSSVIEELAALCPKIAPSLTLDCSFAIVMKSAGGSSTKSKLKKSIQLAYIDFEYLKAIGDSLRGPFAFTIIVVFVLFLLLVIANFQWWWLGEIYLSMVVLKGMTSAIFLWLLTLLSTYLGFVQPIVRETRLLDILDIKALCVGNSGGSV